MRLGGVSTRPSRCTGNEVRLPSPPRFPRRSAAGRGRLRAHVSGLGAWFIKRGETMPNVKPLPVDAPSDRHPAMAAADGIMAHVPGVSAAITAVLQTLQASGSLPPRLIELLRIRIAFHNQCR